MFFLMQYRRFWLWFRFVMEDPAMKSKSELNHIIENIASSESPVGMDAVYVHALILDHLGRIDERMSELEKKIKSMNDIQSDA